MSSDTLFAFAQPPPPVRSGDAPGTVATTVTYWKNLVGSAKRPLWPMLMEKAFAADQPGKQGYTSNFFQNGGLAYEAMEVITGHRGGFYAIGNSEQPTRLVAFSITDSPSVADLGGHSIVGGWLRGDFRAIEPNLMVCAFTPGSRLPNCSPICRESHTCQQPFVNGGVPLDPNNQTVHFEVVDVDGPRSQHRIASFDRNPYDCPDTKPCTINPPESPNGPLAIGFMINRHSRLGGQLPLSTAAEVSAKLTELWNNRRPVVVGTISDIRLYRIGLAPGHAYTLVKYDPSRRELTIRDPITPNPPIPVSIDNFMKLFKQIDYNDADPVPSTNCSCPQ